MNDIELSDRILASEADEERELFAAGAHPSAAVRRSFVHLYSLLTALGLGLGAAVWFGLTSLQGTWAGLLAPLVVIAVGVVGRSIVIYGHGMGGIRNDAVTVAAPSDRGIAALLLSSLLTAFYTALYFDWPRGILDGGVAMIKPLARLLAGAPGDKYFLYSFLYSFAVLIFGLRLAVRYRHNRYQLVRTASVTVFQLGFAFLVPQYLRALDQPEFYPTYFWPLLPSTLFPDSVGSLLAHPGRVGAFMVFWGAALAFLATPVLTYFFGKRWYCSWVCGCGGLAETAGDSFRHLSNKSSLAWRIEKFSIYSVLIAVALLTALLWAWPSSFSESLRRGYGFVISSLFAGVVGVGFYPILGSRAWCRFGCPMAAYLGILQRYFSRFRITTNGSQCISCGNCSAFCEMGIDVRSYAQSGENIVRAACVGCGICAAVCPRGVLRLENGAHWDDRFAGSNRPLATWQHEVADAVGLACDCGAVAQDSCAITVNKEVESDENR